MSRLRNIFISLLMAAAATMPAIAATEAVQRELASPTSSVMVRPGSVELTVSGDEAVLFHIFAITGQQVKSALVSAGTTVSIELPKGVYIVRGDHWAKQVVIR